ncbi:MAG: VWA domain-containing protein, partial [Planctomycetaceae bacterium]|nr:VWA domain-containing protein [Planctomycetaceae bacterium]
EVINPDVPKPKIYDIPEGREIAERLIVRGTTGDSLVQIDSALDRVTWEIANHLQEQKVLVVWLLDASGSLTEQRAAIVKRLDRIYGELGALKNEELIPRLQQPLLSAVVAYGERTHFLTPEPTNKFELIREAIEKVPVDPSGKENVFSAIGQSVDRWSEYRARFGRRIMLIVVTDETGDDFAAHAPAISLCRRYGAISYVIGPHAVFGRQKGFVPYVAPENGKTYNLPVDLGPETPTFDNVEIPFWYDGPQYKYLSSGFGPYALTRLVTETGGIYFSTHMTTMKGFSPEGMFEAEKLKPFEPDYRFGTPDEYLKDLEKHPLRMAVIKAAQISRNVEPEGTPEMELRVTPAGFKNQAKEAQKTVAKSGYFLNRILSAFPNGIEKALDSEPSPRWRMTFCLAYGRLLGQRARCLEYNLALADLSNSLTPQDVGSKSNHWIFRPDKQLNYATSEKRNAELAEKLLRQVLEEAPGTPWAKLAERELRHPFGI